MNTALEKSTAPAASESGRAEALAGDPAPEPFPPHGLLQWVEFFWLSITDPRFRATRYKRKLYFERCMTRGFKLWFYC